MKGARYPRVRRKISNGKVINNEAGHDRSSLAGTWTAGLECQGKEDMGNKLNVIFGYIDCQPPFVLCT